MKNFIYILLIAPLFFISSCEEEGLVHVGDLQSGGIVFYVGETGQHGLVAAYEDIGL